MEIIRIILLGFLTHLSFVSYSQTRLEVNPSILSIPHTIELADKYLDSNKIEEATWILIHSMEQDNTQAEALVKRIKADKSDNEFIRLMENVFWVYAPHIKLIPDVNAQNFHVFEDYIFWKNKLIAFATAHGEEALRFDEVAQQQMAEGDLIAAVINYSSAIDLIPTARRYYRRAQLYEVLRENEQALNDYDSSIKLNAFPAHYYARGELNLKLRYLDDAIRDYTYVIDSQFEYLLYDAYFSRALCLALKGDLNSDKKSVELSIPDFTKAIELNPTADAYKRRGLSYYYGSDNTEESKKDLLRAIELNPNDVQLYFFLGAFEDDFKKSISWLNKCIELNPNYNAAYSVRGNTYYNNGKKKKACKDYKKAMELGNKNAEENYKIYCR